MADSQKQSEDQIAQVFDVSLHEALPWDRLEGDEDAFWVECFSCIGYHEPKGSWRRVQFGEVSVILAEVEYVVPAAMNLRIKSREGDQIKLVAREEPPHTLPESTYVFLATPIIKANLDKEGYSEAAKGWIESVAGLLTAAEGRLAVLDRLSQMVIPKVGPVIQYSAPASFVLQPSPELGSIRIKSIALALANLTYPPKSTVLLALRWSDQAMRAAGVDAFLKAWFAMEIIGIPSGSNIRPIEDRLQIIYGFDRATVVQKFRMGPLHGFRSKIVHEGSITPPHPRLTNYVLAVFTDLLLDTLGLPAEKRALTLIDEPKSPATEWLP